MQRIIPADRFRRATNCRTNPAVRDAASLIALVEAVGTLSSCRNDSPRTGACRSTTCTARSRIARSSCAVSARTRDIGAPRPRSTRRQRSDVRDRLPPSSRGASPAELPPDRRGRASRRSRSASPTDRRTGAESPPACDHGGGCHPSVVAPAVRCRSAPAEPGRAGAQAARRLGLDWKAVTVTQLEKGHRHWKPVEVLLAALVLELAEGVGGSDASPPTLPALLGEMGPPWSRFDGLALGTITGLDVDHEYIVTDVDDVDFLTGDAARGRRGRNRRQDRDAARRDIASRRVGRSQSVESEPHRRTRPPRRATRRAHISPGASRARARHPRAY